MKPHTPAPAKLSALSGTRDSSGAPGARGPARWLLSAVLCLFLIAAPAGARRRHASRHHAPTHKGISRALFKKKSHELHAKLAQKQAQIQSGQQKIQVLAQKGIALSEQIHQDETAEQDASLRLVNAQARLLEINDTLTRTLADLEQTRRRLVKDRACLQVRLREVYEQGDVGVLQALLNSRNILDFMNREEYSRRVVRRDLRIVRQVHLDEQEIAEQSRLLAQMRLQQGQEVQQISYQRQRLDTAIAHRSALLLATEQQIAVARQSVSEMEAESSSIETMLKRLQSIPILTFSGPHGLIHYRVHWSGRFVMPAIGPITSPFGYRFHPILHVYKLHTGVDIGAPWGSPVHAAAAGVVVHASWLGAYGNGIIIDHGDGLATLYGHLSRIEVTVGQPVAQGQIIGAVGSTGLSTGPHLHFEARKYGTPIPPF